MLVLTRLEGESITVDAPGGQVVVEVVWITAHTVKLGITAPKDWPIHRDDIKETKPRQPRNKNREGDL